MCFTRTSESLITNKLSMRVKYNLIDCVNKIMDGVVRKANNITIAKKKLSPYLVMMDLAMILSAVYTYYGRWYYNGIKYSDENSINHTEKNRINLSMTMIVALSHIGYETVYKKIKNYLFGGSYRSFLLDLVVFYLPSFTIGGYLANIPISVVMDNLSSILPILVSVTKIGCFLSGCCYGNPSTLGVKYPEEIFKSSQTMGCQTTVPSEDPIKRVYPMQLVDCGSNVLVFSILQLVRKYSSQYGINLPSGSGMSLYILFYIPLRFFIDFWRAPSHRPRRFGNTLTEGQSIALILYIFNAFYLKYCMKVSLSHIFSLFSVTNK